MHITFKSSQDINKYSHSVQSEMRLKILFAFKVFNIFKLLYITLIEEKKKFNFPVESRNQFSTLNFPSYINVIFNSWKNLL